MQIFTSLIPSDPLPPAPAAVAVVIDVLRATSVAATALAAGATEVMTCREVDQARTLARNQPAETRLCGERGCRPIEGFDLGNSPAEYTAQSVAGRRLVLTTTNGTLAIEVAAAARSMVLASFLNLSAVVQAIADADSVHLVCAGTDGRITGEDVLLAGAIVDRCLQRLAAECQVCDASTIARQWWLGCLPNADPRSLAECLALTGGGRNLIRVGYQEDLVRCAAIDSLAIVPTRTQLNPPTFASQKTAVVDGRPFGWFRVNPRGAHVGF